MFDILRRWFARQPVPQGASRVHEAAKGDANALRDLLRRNRSLSNLRHGSFQRVPLHTAAESGASECVRLLLEHGAAANARDGLHGWTPLHSAVSSDAVDCVALLLSHGAEANAADSRGETPIFYAKSRGVLDQLVDAGADLDVYSTRGQYPFQHCAAYIRSPEVLRFWLERGVPVNHIPDFGWPALQAVCAGDKREIDYDKGIEMLGMLIEHGADVNLQGSDGRTPLMESCFNWHAPFVETLLQAGADANLQNVAGDTALHAAVFRREKRAVELLLNHKADVNLANRHRKTAFDICEDDAIRAVLEPHHQPKTWLLPTAEEVVRRLRAIPRYANVSLNGCSDSEIRELEERFSVVLPASYKEFLRLFGHGAGDFMVSDRWSFQYKELFEMARDEEYAEDCDLPENYFVFAVRDGWLCVFLIPDGQDDDPPVYCFSDSEDRSFEQHSRSVWEFVDSLVADYEIWEQGGE